MHSTHSLSCIVPPHLLDRLSQSANRDVRDAAMRTLLTTTELRGERDATPRSVGRAAAATSEHGRRTIYDVRGGEDLSGAVVARTETGSPSSDDSVNRAFDGLGATRRFYADVFGRDSIDDRGMPLRGYVHFSVDFNNAFWDGRQMVFGDGDGQFFSDLTGSLDVIAHELTHGVTGTTADLVYHLQPGALNESMSDVFGSVVKQWALNQTADQADWLIGADVFTPQFAGDALRSMKAPGTAYDNPEFGTDPQPGHMKNFVVLPDTARGDNGGVHINSGIPNHAFYLAATAIGGQAWKAPAQIWYAALLASGPQTSFQQFADTTVGKAGALYGANGIEQQAVREAWAQVGLTVSAPAGERGLEAGATSLDTLAARIDALSADVQALTKMMAAPKLKSGSTAHKTTHKTAYKAKSR